MKNLTDNQKIKVQKSITFFGIFSMFIFVFLNYAVHNTIFIKYALVSLSSFFIVIGAWTFIAGFISGWIRGLSLNIDLTIRGTKARIIGVLWIILGLYLTTVFINMN